MDARSRLALLGLAGVLAACDTGAGGLQGPGGGMGQGRGGSAGGSAGPGGERAGARPPGGEGGADRQLPESACEAVPTTHNLEPDDGTGAPALARIEVEVEHGGISDPEREPWCAGASVLNRGQLHVRIEPRRPVHLWLATVDPEGEARVHAPRGDAASAVDAPQRHTFRIEGGEHRAAVLLVVSGRPLTETAPELARQLREGKVPQRGRALVELSSGAIRAIADEHAVATVPLPYEHVFVGVSPGGAGQGAVLVRG